MLSVIGIVTGGLLLRVWIAPAPGYTFDSGTVRGWSYSAVALGVGQSYTRQMKGSMLPNYPPLSMLLFSTTGWIYMKTVSPSFDIEAPAFHIGIKLPAIIADLLTALLLCILITHWKKNQWWGVTAAALYALHPVTLHNSAFWGQTDAIYSLFLVATFGAYVYGFATIAGMCMVLALLTKLQALACAPLFVVLMLRSGWRPAFHSLLGGCAALTIVLLPFWWTGTLNDVIDVMVSSVGFYDSISNAAYNAWWALYADATGSMHDTEKLFGLMSFRHIGMMLFSISVLYPIIVLWRGLKPSPKTGSTLPIVFFTAAFSTLAFFLWNTQMHERYSFAFIPLGFMVAFTSARAARLYVLTAFFIFMNVLGWLQIGALDTALYREFPTLDVFVASVLVCLFFCLAGLALDVQRMLSESKSQLTHHPHRYVRTNSKKKVRK